MSELLYSKLNKQSIIINIIMVPEHLFFLQPLLKDILTLDFSWNKLLKLVNI